MRRSWSTSASSSALADTVAKAHKEGGFLGIGGTQVSEHEQAALDEIAAIFDEKQAG